MIFICSIKYSILH